MSPTMIYDHFIGLFGDEFVGKVHSYISSKEKNTIRIRMLDGNMYTFRYNSAKDWVLTTIGGSNK